MDGFMAQKRIVESSKKQSFAYPGKKEMPSLREKGKSKTKVDKEVGEDAGKKRKKSLGRRRRR